MLNSEANQEIVIGSYVGKHPSLRGGTNFGKILGGIIFLRFFWGEPKESAILGGDSQKTAIFWGGNLKNL